MGALNHTFTISVLLEANPPEIPIASSEPNLLAVAHASETMSTEARIDRPSPVSSERSECYSIMASILRAALISPWAPLHTYRDAEK